MDSHDTSADAPPSTVRTGITDRTAPAWQAVLESVMEGDYGAVRALDESYAPAPADPRRPPAGEQAEAALHLQDEPSPPEQAVGESSVWPELNPKALHGLAGEYVQLLEPHTEADPVAILAQLLVGFGSVVGCNPHFRVEATRHGTNLFSVLVGESSKARKGTSAQHVFALLEALDPEWKENCVAKSLSSGEGLINAVRDPVEKQEPIKEAGKVVDYQTVITDHGVDDKRLLVIEEEFSSPLKVMKRDGNTLSPVIRSAWDGTSLRTLTRSAPMRSSDPHISIMGHITARELVQHLGSTEAGNGFGNRFLWLLASRSKCLPEGGAFHTVDRGPMLRGFREALTFARQCGEVRRDDTAREIWAAVYPSLSEGKPGLLGAMIARAEAQVMRLAMLYALLDRSAEIRPDHLVAALALWEYAELSARYIFGEALGDQMADEILRVLRASPDGLTRTQLRDHFGRHKSAEMDRALRTLEAQGLAHKETIETGGRPAERWRASAT